MDEIEVVDLGDAMEETKQCSPAAYVPDSWFGWGTHPWPPWPGQCDNPY